jgi:superfamily II DNA/RNA helicase
VLLALLSRYYSSNEKWSKPSCLYIVPHNDLALQLYHWGLRIISSMSMPTKCNNNMLQICARGIDELTVDDQVTLFLKRPANIIIGTTGGIVDIMEHKEVAARFNKLDTIVVDEADSLLNLPKKFARKSDWTKFHRHPPPLLTLFKLLSSQRAQEKVANTKRLQLVLSSATMPSRTRGYIYACSESLFAGGGMQKVNLVERENKSSFPSQVEHIAVVVFPDGTVMDLTDYSQDKALIHTSDVGFGRERDGASSYVLESVARVFKEEAVRCGLLVVKSGSGIKRIVEGLRVMGVRADILDMARIGSRGEPRLMVCEEARVRGIDVPSATHVFIDGVAKSVRMYEQIAGRVGRRGTRGWVVSFLDGEDKRGIEEMKRMLAKLKISVSA